MTRQACGFDCRRFLDRCEGACCGPCPVPVDTWRRHQGDLQRPAAHAIDDGEGYIHQVGEDGRCCFQRPDFTCAIYPAPGEADERAEVCRRFGDASHPMLTCIWQDADGRARRRPERRELMRLISGQVNDTMRRLRQGMARRRKTLLRPSGVADRG